MSNTSVKVKASSVPSEKKSEVKDVSRAKDTGAASMHAASTMKSASDSPESTSDSVESLMEKAQPYLDKHGRTIAYGLIGIAAAVLILTIGFWPVLLLAAFAAIGVAIGMYRDGDAGMQAATKSLVSHFRK